MAAAYEPPSVGMFRLLTGLHERSFGGPLGLMNTDEFDALVSTLLVRTGRQLALEVGETEFARIDLSANEQGVLEDAHIFAAAGHAFNILLGKEASGIGENLTMTINGLERAADHFDRMRRKQIAIFIGGELRERALREVGP